jgi:hypothetical protein
MESHHVTAPIPGVAHNRGSRMLITIGRFHMVAEIARHGSYFELPFLGAIWIERVSSGPIVLDSDLYGHGFQLVNGKLR